MRALRPAHAVELLALALLLAVEGLLFSRGLRTPADYDEGVYLAAVDAYRHGQELGSEIFTAQPPGFYWLLTAGDWIFGNSLAGVRHFVLALALLGCAGAYLTGRAVGGPPAGFGAALLLGMSPPFPTFATRISADLPSLAVGLLALAAFLHALPRARPGPALLAGVVLAIAVSVKLSALVLLVPLVAFGIRRRLPLRPALAFCGGSVAAGAAIVLVNVGHLHSIWHDAVSYHSAARRVPGLGFSSNLDTVLNFFHWRTPLTWLLLLAAAAFAVGLVRTRLPLWPLWLNAAASAGVLLWQRPLHDNHGVLLAVALAVPTGAALGAAAARLQMRETAAAAALVLALGAAAGYAKEWRRLDRNRGPEPADVRWAVRELDLRTAPAEHVVTDLPIVAFLAHRRVPGQLVDPAVLRFQAGYLTAAQVFGAIRERHVRVVVAGRAFTLFPDIQAGLRARFPARIRHGGVTLYLRSAAASG